MLGLSGWGLGGRREAMCDWGFTEEKRQSGRTLRVLCGKAGAWDRQIAQFLLVGREPAGEAGLPVLASGQTAVQDSCPSSRHLTAHGRMKPGFTVLGVRGLRIGQAQGYTHTVIGNTCALTQVQTQIHRHT